VESLMPLRGTGFSLCAFAFVSFAFSCPDEALAK
jgi:hypothetical protein